MQKYPSDVSVHVSRICIDANLEKVERRYPDNFPLFPPQENGARGQCPKLPLVNNITSYIHVLKKFDTKSDYTRGGFNM